jgi:aminoglycoside phosphotransferase family enzyme
MKKKTETTLPKLLAKAQIVFNRYIRNRDKDKGCVSCGTTVTEAGHYYSQGHHSALRFNEVNTNGQCTRCNRFLHGNLVNYRHGLAKRYTQQQIDILDSIGTRNPVKKWTRFEIAQIIEKYSNFE